MKVYLIQAYARVTAADKCHYLEARSMQFSGLKYMLIQSHGLQPVRLNPFGTRIHFVTFLNDPKDGVGTIVHKLKCI